MPVGQEHTNRFDVQGSVKQTIVMVDPDVTLEQLRVRLISGVYATTIQEGGEVIEVATDAVIAKVVDVDNECEYLDYDVEEEQA